MWHSFLSAADRGRPRTTPLLAVWKCSKFSGQGDRDHQSESVWYGESGLYGWLNDCDEVRCVIPVPHAIDTMRCRNNFVCLLQRMVLVQTTRHRSMSKSSRWFPNSRDVGPYISSLFEQVILKEKRTLSLMTFVENTSIIDVSAYPLDVGTELWLIILRLSSASVFRGACMQSELRQSRWASLAVIRRRSERQQCFQTGNKFLCEDASGL